MGNNSKSISDYIRDFSAIGHHREESKLLPFALGAVVGGLIGATFAMLFAPTEGATFRREMGEKLDGVVGGTKELLRGARSSAEKLFSDGQDSYDSIKDDVNSAASNVREKADGILEDADRTISQARQQTT
jgi:gas vesicle protein